MNLKKIQNLHNTPIGKTINAVRYLNGYSPLFLGICLILTYRCNLNCEFCLQAKKRKEFFPDMDIKDVEIIEKNIRSAFSFTPRVHLFGGEPTVNKNFLEIVNFFSQKNYRISLTTNGLELDKYAKDIAVAKGLKEMHISLNASNFEKLPLTLRILKEGKPKDKIYVTIACPINKTNQNNLLGIVKAIENCYADCIAFQYATFTDGYKVDMDLDSVKRQIEEIKKTHHKISVLFLPDIKPEDIKNYYNDSSFPYKKNKCTAPWFVPFIQPNGNIIPCDEVDIVMGNIKE